MDEVIYLSSCRQRADQLLTSLFIIYERSERGWWVRQPYIDDRARTCEYCQYDGALRAWVESTAVRRAFCRVCGRRSIVRRLLLVCSDCVAARRRRRVLDAFSASPTIVFELFSTTLPDSDY